MDLPSSHVANDFLKRADDFARQEPMKAVISAAGAGFFVNLLPLGAIAAALVAVFFSFLRPALLFLGLMKACELCELKLDGTSTDD